ncbi:restriction endonuclease subunit S [Nonlabens sp. Asnod3-H03]|uniref:restriction endonuclease subunit S n=1 Tax=Nonlabens sp. Asnod3-H03 TaxID=3160580 RepID=UPI0038648A49
MRDNWKELVIGNELNFLGGFPFSSSKFNEQGDGIPLIRIRDLLNSSQETYYSGEYSNSYLIKEGDVLVGMDGDFHLVRWKNSPSLLNQRILKISEKKSSEIDIDFLFYYLKPFLLDVHNKTAATTVKHLSTFDVSRAVDLFPPLPQQKKIAQILSTVDEVIEQTESAIAKYQAIKQGLMHDLFTRGIDINTGKLRPSPQDAPQLYKESALGLIPREWEVEELGVLTSKVVDGTHFTPTYTENGVPFLRVTDVQTNKIDFEKIKYVSKVEHNELIKRCHPERGDILYSKNGTIGIPKLVDWDWEFSIFVSLALIKPKKEIIQSEYLLQLLPEEIIWKQIRQRAKQGTVTNLHLEEIREFLIPLPNKIEQQAICKRGMIIKNKIQTEQQALGKYQQLKSGLMQDLLTGRVGVVVD